MAQAIDYQLPINLPECLFAVTDVSHLTVSSLTPTMLCRTPAGVKAPVVYTLPTQTRQLPIADCLTAAAPL
jgi:hypothetical protein